MPTESTPLLWNGNFARTREIGEDVHSQFCSLTGCPPSNAPSGYKHHINDKSIYGRATAGLRSQQSTYLFTAALTNTLLLSQVVLGAALTALGAAKVPYYMVTIFGATNTIIAGLVAYLKSRGQPMRSRMYRDDLERVVDEIENSEVMWLGISQGVNGYRDLVDGRDKVTVRDEVARLTRLYDRAVRTNNLNNPDLYAAGGSDPSGTKPAVPANPSGTTTQQPVKANEPTASNPIGTRGASTSAPQNTAPAPAPAPTTDPDQSPASAPPASQNPDESNTKPVSTDTDNDRPAAERKSDLDKPTQDKDKDSTAAANPASSTSDPSTSTTKDATPTKSPNPVAPPNPSTGTTPPPAAIAPPTAPPTSSVVAPLSIADVDQSPATRPRVAPATEAGKEKNGDGGDGDQGVARKVKGDTE